MAGETAEGIDGEENLAALSSMLEDSEPRTESVEQMHAQMRAMETEIARLKRETARPSSPPDGGGCDPERGVAKAVLKRRASDEAQHVLTDKHSGLRIRNPLVSSALLRQRMEGRKMVRVSQLLGRQGSEFNEGDWVTTGVVVAKLPPKNTVKGKKFVVWRLSDLSSQSAVVGLFLFGAAYEAHWKTAQGSVVALLNARLLPASESGSGTALALDNPQKLMLLGTSQDFTSCKAHCKNGQMCSNFAKLSDGGYCDYHTHGAYKRLRSQRMEFQNGYGPSASAGGLREKLFKGSKTEVFYYGGQSYSSAGGEGSRRKASPPKQQAARSSTQQGSKLLAQMLQRQSAGARMLQKHLSSSQPSKQSNQEGGAAPRSARQVLQERLTGPKLARGFETGDKFVALSPPSRAKLKAIAVLRRKNSQPEEEEQHRASIKRKVEACAVATAAEPSPKRPRREEEEEDAERIFRAKSSHEWVVCEEEDSRVEGYFSRLEQQEALEEKLGQLKQLKVSAVCCKQCGYTAQSQGERCCRENHSVSHFKTLKRCFKCSGCGERCFTYGARYPAASCSRCGKDAFTASSFHKERAGPKLPSEELLIRGREEKFLH